MVYQYLDYLFFINKRYYLLLLFYIKKELKFHQHLLIQVVKSLNKISNSVLRMEKNIL